MYDPFFSPFDQFIFSFGPIFIFIVFCLIMGMFIFQGVNYAKDKSKPIQTERAKVIAKRTNVSHHHHNMNDHMHHSTSTTYYITFEFITGQRMELKVPSKQFGYIIEGDEGLLQFQGRLFVSFERTSKV